LDGPDESEVKGLDEYNEVDWDEDGEGVDDHEREG